MLKFLSYLLQKIADAVSQGRLTGQKWITRDLFEICKVRSGPRTRLQVSFCGAFGNAFFIRASKRMMVGTCRYKVDATWRFSSWCFLKVGFLVADHG
jgi:hypothetical protein